MPISSKMLFGLILVLGVTALALTIGCNLELPQRVSGGSSQSLDELPPEFERLAEAWTVLKDEHFDRERLDAQTLSDGAIRGMLQALDDPYASYLDAAQFEVESQDYRGFFEGIGAQVAMDDGQLTIIAPLPDTPAERSGIEPGDIILEIDGNGTAGISLLEAVSKIRGEKDTIVVLLVLHLDGREPVSIDIRRGVIPLTSVRFSMLDDGIGHLRISNFRDTTDQEVKEALSELQEASGAGLILDLRNNPGGLLSSVADVANQFLEDGLVLYEIDAHGQRTNWDVQSRNTTTDVPMVVLINAFSASASEVLSGALIDHQRATVIGTTSFGKGSVNTLRSLEDGSGIYFSIGRWYTPAGTLIEGEGITPDIVVELNREDTEDTQLQKGIEFLQGQFKGNR